MKKIYVCYSPTDKDKIDEIFAPFVDMCRIFSRKNFELFNNVGEIDLIIVAISNNVMNNSDVIICETIFAINNNIDIVVINLENVDYENKINGLGLLLSVSDKDIVDFTDSRMIMEILNRERNKKTINKREATPIQNIIRCNAYLGRENYAFISYSSGDFEKLINSRITLLTENDINVWYDQAANIKDADAMKRIEERLRNSEVVVVFISNNAIEYDNWIIREVRLSKRLNKQIIPVYIEEIKLTGELLNELIRYNKVDCYGDEEQTGQIELKNRLVSCAQKSTEQRIHEWYRS